MSLEEIAATYDLPLAAVYAAMAYYYDRQAEIDQSIAKDEAFVAEYIATHPSTLLSRIRQSVSEQADHSG